jgi:exodeoxyribonuclease VII small subunit
MAAKNERKVEDMSFEEALEELQGLVKSLEKGETKLDDAVRQYERGMALKHYCQKKLNEAQARIEQIVVSPDGAIGATQAKLD